MFNLLNSIFDASKLSGTDYEYLVPIVEFLDKLVVPLTVTLLVGAAILSICIGVAIAKADSSDKSSEMKKRLWGLMIAVLIVVALTWILGWILSGYPTIMAWFKTAFNFSAGRGTGSFLYNLFI